MMETHRKLIFCRGRKPWNQGIITSTRHKKVYHYYTLRMLYSWYDKLMKIVPEIGQDTHGERYTDGSTTCTIRFLSAVKEDPLDDWLRAKLGGFEGWMELIDYGPSKR